MEKMADAGYAVTSGGKTVYVDEIGLFEAIGAAKSNVVISVNSKFDPCKSMSYLYSEMKKKVALDLKKKPDLYTATVIFENGVVDSPGISAEDYARQLWDVLRAFGFKYVVVHVPRLKENEWIAEVSEAVQHMQESEDVESIANAGTEGFGARYGLGGRNPSSMSDRELRMERGTNAAARKYLELRKKTAHSSKPTIKVLFQKSLLASSETGQKQPDVEAANALMAERGMIDPKSANPVVDGGRKKQNIMDVTAVSEGTDRLIVVTMLTSGNDQDKLTDKEEAVVKKAIMERKVVREAFEPPLAKGEEVEIVFDYTPLAEFISSQIDDNFATYSSSENGPYFPLTHKITVGEFDAKDKKVYPVNVTTTTIGRLPYGTARIELPQHLNSNNLKNKFTEHFKKTFARWTGRLGNREYPKFVWGYDLEFTVNLVQE